MEKPKCSICGGSGFSKPGVICTCITKDSTKTSETPDIPDFLRDIFGDKKGG